MLSNELKIWIIAIIVVIVWVSLLVFLRKLVHGSESFPPISPPKIEVMIWNDHEDMKDRVRMIQRDLFKLIRLQLKNCNDLDNLRDRFIEILKANDLVFLAIENKIFSIEQETNLKLLKLFISMLSFNIFVMYVVYSYFRYKEALK